VRNIIQKHHSRVYLVSEVGIGTTFWFDLDVAKEKTTVEQRLQVDTDATTETSSAAASVM
jgi:two-component system sensor histidine kinase NblS